jgi:hypothetical protein
VIPNDRLVRVIDDAAQYEEPRAGGDGWLMAQIPLTTAPGDPKNDDILLVGLATSFFVRKHEKWYVLELEIFHL